MVAAISWGHMARRPGNRCSRFSAGARSDVGVLRANDLPRAGQQVGLPFPLAPRLVLEVIATCAEAVTTVVQVQAATPDSRLAQVRSRDSWIFEDTL